jgi:hypothetical protein
VIEIFEKNNLPYMVVGSIASMTYGEPRMTNDMDMVIDILYSDAQKIEQLFPIEQYYCPPIEVLKNEIIQKGQFNLIHQNTGLKIDLMIRKNNPHSIEEFNRKQLVPFVSGKSIYMATPEDIIIKKLIFYRDGGSEKHLTDIRGILTDMKIDSLYLTSWIEKLNLQIEYKKI